MEKTFCRICEAHCGLVIERNETGDIRKLRPDREHPISQGFVCAKGLRFLDVADHPDRLLYPHIRRGGALQRATWAEALTHIRRVLRPLIERHGPHAVGVYFGTPMIHNGLGIIAMTQFIRRLGTRNVYSAGSQDNNNKFAAGQIVHGSDYIQPIMDLQHADFALLLGTNPVVSQGTFVHMPAGTQTYDAFIERGGQLVLVDPRRTESAERWGGHLPIRPSTDVFLLLALLNACRDLPHPPAPGLDALLTLAAAYPAEHAAALTGIPAKRIRGLAADIRAADRATFFLSVGVNQGPFGTLSMVAMQALAYVTGSFDRRGGLLFQPRARWLRWLAGTPPQTSRIGGYVSNAGGLPCGILPDEILTQGAGQIRALIVLSGNPLTSAPDEAHLREAFEALDLLVSVDLFENHTGRLADVLLPGVTWLERFDLAGWDVMHETEPYLQYGSRARQAPGACRTEARIMAELSLAAGRPFPGARLLTRLDADALATRLMSLLRLPIRRKVNGAEVVPWFAPREGVYRRGKPRFWDEGLDAERERLRATPVERPPGTFTLIGRRRRLAQNSWIHNAGREVKAREARAWLHPADFDTLGLAPGDEVTIESDVGRIRIAAAPSDTVMRGTVVVPHGLPGVNVNVLVPGHTIEPVSGMQQMSGHAVRIRA